MSTNYLNTLDGRKWQERFLDGDATMADTQEMVQNMEILERWRKIGMLNGDGDPKSDEETRRKMAEGNTLLCLAVRIYLQMKKRRTSLVLCRICRRMERKMLLL